MPISCTNIIDELARFVDITNLELIDNMTSTKMKYEYVCIKPNLTYTYYYDRLRDFWNDAIGKLISNQSKCSGPLAELINIYQFATPDRVAMAKKVFSQISMGDRTDNINIENIVLDVISSNLMEELETGEFDLKENFMDSLISLGKTLVTQCQCQAGDIYKSFISKYGQRYRKKFAGMTKDQIIDMIRTDYQHFKSAIKNFSKADLTKIQSSFYDGLADKLTGLYSLNVGGELDRLIPAELGSLKQFFIKIISKYYDNLHPIIWAQIFKGVAKNLFVDLPYTPEEIFSFMSKQLLLNSGPFILKILQMIRPFLSPELAAKYNLTKLTYPVLKPEQIDLMLSKVVYDWDMYKILENFSASVGHVSKVVKVDRPRHPFMIKMIKPLAVAQSCWEYHILHDIFPIGSCEQEFVKNMLDSNGKELDVQNEIRNIDDGYKYYTIDYKSAFNVGVNAKLTTIQNIPNIIVSTCWYALAMTIAPGVPLSKLVECDLIKADTRYSAKLHRCLDLLVYKFFQNIVRNGFYHGDLHAGNIFFSYEDAQMTLIDFGAIGHIDIYAKDDSTKVLLDIVVMSVFNNYDELLDRMTVLLNTRCTETQIDMSSPEYLKLRKELYEYKIRNIGNEDTDKLRSKTYEKDIFSQERIDQEENDNQPNIHETNVNNNQVLGSTIYSYLDYIPMTTIKPQSGPKCANTFIENRDVLPPFTNISGKSDSISFPTVLEKIIKFYALAGVNIAIKFSEFYEFQKAYALLLGVLHKVNYNPYRTGIAIGRAIKSWGNLPQLLNISTVSHVVKTYRTESNKHKELKNQIRTGSVSQMAKTNHTINHHQSKGFIQSYPLLTQGEY